MEFGEVQRFSSIKKAISYCGLSGDEQRSANSAQRAPISRQRNKHLQTTLIEAAKMAPRYRPMLALLYDREEQKGNANRATLAVARRNRIFQRSACQVSPLSNWARQRELSMLP